MPEDTRKETLPDNLNICLRAFDTEESANNLGKNLLYITKELSKDFDVSELEGITVAFDYNEALSELDRGVETNVKLKASADRVVGVAMTASVLREGNLKSHLFFNASYLQHWLMNGNEDDVRHAIHVIAHEFAHVEFNKYFNICFPDITLRQKLPNITVVKKYEAGIATWDEFFATRHSALVGDSRSEGYVTTLLEELSEAEAIVGIALYEYQTHRNVVDCYNSIAEQVLRLMKFSGYVIGDCYGSNKSLSDIEILRNELANSWFKPYFEALGKDLEDLAEEYSQWSSFSPFDNILQQYDNLLQYFGVVVDNEESSTPYVHFYSFKY
ncbi:hypothetical protein [Marisediminitalea sp.]|uniref:hypothetical protein n=1 Tax=Marisediminitalea sp. TaxID=2662268 RepID=UPI00351466B4